MKKIVIILITLCLLLAIALPCLAFADEIPDEQPPGDEPEESETVEVDAELWAEIVAMLEKIKNAETADNVSDIVYETFFTRMTAWFGDNASTIILVVEIIFIAVWTIINRNSKFKLKNGINAAYNKTLEIYKTDSEMQTKIDSVLSEIKGSQITEEDRKIAKATLDLMWTMLNNSSALPQVKANGKMIYDDAKQ